MANKDEEFFNKYFYINNTGDVLFRKTSRHIGDSMREMISEIRDEGKPQNFNEDVENINKVVKDMAQKYRAQSIFVEYYSDTNTCTVEVKS